MGSETIPTRSDGQTIDENWFNILKNVLRQNFVPRNASGVATSLAGTLGESALKWMRAYIEVGYWDPGDIKAHHTYNDTVEVGQGWMLCNGDIINETNYDAQHSAGDWATYIGTSPLDGKHLPDMNNKYLRGDDATTQSGSSALTYVGNAGNTININHSHNSNNWHTNITIGTNAVWMSSKVSSWTGDRSISITGGATLSTGTFAGLAERALIPNQATSSTLSSSQSIAPHSLQVQFWMRII